MNLKPSNLGANLSRRLDGSTSLVDSICAPIIQIKRQINTHAIPKCKSNSLFLKKIKIFFKKKLAILGDEEEEGFESTKDVAITEEAATTEATKARQPFICVYSQCPGTGAPEESRERERERDRATPQIRKKTAGAPPDLPDPKSNPTPVESCLIWW